ncbi:MAG: mechanosensitive ion channel family protein [Candidatus Micrarchaeia archaeon]
MRGQAASIALVVVLLFLLSGLLFFASTAEMAEMKQTLLDASTSALILLVAIAARALLNAFFDYSMRNYPLDVLKSLKALTTAFIFAATLLVIIAIFTKDEAIFTVVIAGFVLTIIITGREFLEDFARRLALLSSAAINIGDYVEVDGIRGRVVEFGVMYTTIRQDDNTLVSIPNRELLGMRVTNYSKAPHLKVQDSIELRVGKREAEKIASEIQTELELKGFKRCRVTPFKSGDRVRFVASVLLEESANIREASMALAKTLKRMASKYG